jgi:hypothetical protein
MHYAALNLEQHVHFYLNTELLSVSQILLCWEF